MSNAQTAQDDQAKAPAQDAAAVDVQEAELPEAAKTSATGSGQIDILLDTPLSVSACLGQVQLPVRELLQFAPGSVVPLDREAGEPIDLYLRGVRFATGHIVVVNDRLAVRIKEVLSPGGGQADAEP